MDEPIEQAKARTRRLIQVLRSLQLYAPGGAADGVFAADVAVLDGFIRGEIREAMYHAAQRPEGAPSSRCLQPYQGRDGRMHECLFNDGHNGACGKPGLQT